MKRRLIKWKVYYDRARMYVGMVQSLMIATMFIEVLDIQIDRSYYPLVFVGFIVGALCVGFMDTKIGLRKEEMKNLAMENPVFVEILERIRRIESNSNSPNDHPTPANSNLSRKSPNAA